VAQVSCGGELAKRISGALQAQPSARRLYRLLHSRIMNASGGRVLTICKTLTETLPVQRDLLPDDDFLAAMLVVAGLLVGTYVLGMILIRICERRHSTEVLFFPDPSGDNVARVCREIDNARRRVWLAMFTLTDDVLSNALLRASKRGVDVRLVVDDEQCDAMGADPRRLAEAGVPVATDKSWARMHHKFAVVDNAVLSGSFNWTCQASRANCENLCIMKERAVVQQFAQEFKRLWLEFHHGQGVLAKRKRANRSNTPPPRNGGG